jgi:hypothetical protein
MTVQTLAVGNTVASKYGRLGGLQNKRMVPPPSALLGAIVGFSNSGKSNLAQSHPDAFIFNTDLSSTTHHPIAKAMIWPGLDSQGRPCEQCSEGETGSYLDDNLGWIRPCELTWDAMLEKKKLLIEMARNNEPRPSTIFIDTVFGAVKVCMPWIAKNAVSLGIWNGAPVADFKQLYGESSYDRLYDEIISLGTELRKVGYGVYFVVHLAEKLVKRKGTAEREKETGFTITDNFWLRMFPMFEIVMEVDVITKTRATKIPPKTVEIKGVKTVIGKETTGTETYKQRVLIVDSPDPDLARIVKQRIVMPGTFELPPQDAWAAFVELYNKHAALTN